MECFSIWPYWKLHRVGGSIWRAAGAQSQYDTLAMLFIIYESVGMFYNPKANRSFDSYTY